MAATKNTESRRETKMAEIGNEMENKRDYGEIKYYELAAIGQIKAMIRSAERRLMDAEAHLDKVEERVARDKGDDFDRGNAYQRLSDAEICIDEAKRCFYDREESSLSELELERVRALD